MTLEVAIERDTQGVPGSPDIAATIFEKIKEASAFVADVSIVNKSSRSAPWYRRTSSFGRDDSRRLTPNPNVLIELGFAFAELGDSRVIMVMNTHFGGPEKLPFDLRKRRVIQFSASPSDTNRAAERKRLSSQLEAMLRASMTAPGRLPPKIAGATRRRMIEVLRESSRRLVGIWTDMPDLDDQRDSQSQFVLSLEDTFREAGWEVVTLTQVGLRSRPRGLTLFTYEGNTPPSDPDFAPITAALDVAAIPYRRSRIRYGEVYGYTEGISTSDPVIYVGPLYRS